METVVIATTTQYESPDDLRARLTLATIQEVEKYKHQIVIVDASPIDVKNLFRAHGATVISEEKKGMGVSRRQAIQEALNQAGEDRIIAWMEPEKTNFVVDLGMIASEIKNNSFDLVIPRRKSLNSYPFHQRCTESTQNEAFKLLTGKSFDICFGPRVFRPDIAAFFLDYKGEYGDRWDSIYVPVLRAIKAGKKVTSATVDFIYPQEQKETEEKSFAMLENRIDQLVSSVETMKKECEILEITP